MASTSKATRLILFHSTKVDAYAKAHQQSAALGRMQEKVAEMIKQMEAAQKTKPVRLMLADVNDPRASFPITRIFYYALLSLGNEKEQPGAELNARRRAANAVDLLEGQSAQDRS